MPRLRGRSDGQRWRYVPHHDRRDGRAAVLEGGERIDVRVDLDTEERVVTPPADLVKPLNAEAVEGATKR